MFDTPTQVFHAAFYFCSIKQLQEQGKQFDTAQRTATNISLLPEKYAIVSKLVWVLISGQLYLSVQVKALWSKTPDSIGTIDALKSKWVILKSNFDFIGLASNSMGYDYLKCTQFPDAMRDFYQ